MTYFALKNQHPIEQFEEKSEAVAFIESEFNAHQDEFPEEAVTFSVVDDAGNGLACRTNRRIVASIHLQRWIPPREDYLEELSVEKIYITDKTLNQDLRTLQETLDRADSSDWIKEGSVEHDGPFDVEAEDSIIEFFGVEGTFCITAEMLEYVKAWFQPKTSKTHVATLTVSLEVNCEPGIDISEVLKTIKHSFKSNIVGACVLRSEIEKTEVRPIG